MLIALFFTFVSPIPFTKSVLCHLLTEVFETSETGRSLFHPKREFVFGQVCAEMHTKLCINHLKYGVDHDNILGDCNTELVYPYYTFFENIPDSVQKTW